MDESARRLQLASRISVAFQATDGLQAVMLTGSSARGWADHWSDIELSVTWDELPGERVRGACAAALGATNRRTFDGGEEEFVVDGLKVDVFHRRQSELVQTLHLVTVECDTNLNNHVVVAALRDAVPLHGHHRIASWQEGARRYPDALQRAMIERDLVFGPHWWLEMLAARGDLVSLYDIFGRIARAVVGIALAVNRTYTSSESFKWAGRMVRGLECTPIGLEDRLDQMYRESPETGVHVSRSLIEDTLALVAEHRPDIDIAHVAKRVRSARRGAG